MYTCERCKEEFSVLANSGVAEIIPPYVNSLERRDVLLCPECEVEHKELLAELEGEERRRINAFMGGKR